MADMARGGFQWTNLRNSFSKNVIGCQTESWRYILKQVLTEREAEYKNTSGVIEVQHFRDVKDVFHSFVQMVLSVYVLWFVVLCC